MEKHFTEVFPPLHIEQPLTELLEQVRVERVTSNRAHMVFFWKCDLGSPEEVEFQDAVSSQLEENAVAVELQDFLGGGSQRSRRSQRSRPGNRRRKRHRNPISQRPNHCSMILSSMGFFPKSCFFKVCSKWNICSLWISFPLVR